MPYSAFGWYAEATLYPLARLRRPLQGMSGRCVCIAVRKVNCKLHHCGGAVRYRPLRSLVTEPHQAPDASISPSVPGRFYYMHKVFKCLAGCEEDSSSGGRHDSQCGWGQESTAHPRGYEAEVARLRTTGEIERHSLAAAA